MANVNIQKCHSFHTLWPNHVLLKNKKITSSKRKSGSTWHNDWTTIKYLRFSVSFRKLFDTIMECIKLEARKEYWRHYISEINAERLENPVAMKQMHIYFELTHQEFSAVLFDRRRIFKIKNRERVDRGKSEY